MADHAAIRQSGTQALAADTVDTVTFDSDCNRVEVWADGVLTFRVDGDAPVVGDTEGYDLPEPGARDVAVPTSGNTVVKLISDAGCNYVVTKLS